MFRLARIFGQFAGLPDSNEKNDLEYDDGG
jgi:hypothetical protein